MIFHCFTSYFIFLIIEIFYVQAFIDEPCKYDEDCFVEHSYCEVQQICQCKENFLVTENRETCIATFIDEPCKYDEDCFVEHSCFDRLLICHPVGSFELANIYHLVGAYCHSKYDCSSLPNSICKNFKCECDSGFIPDPQKSRCLPVATNYDGPCNFRNQCLHTFGPNSECIGHKCQCITNYHFHGYCLFNIGLHQPCVNNSQCYIGENFKETVVCSSGICQCKDGYHQNDARVCISGSPIQKTSIGLFIFICTIIFYKAASITM